MRTATSVSFSTVTVHPRADEIRKQMGRMLTSPLFKNSKHYPALLRYLVEETLEGRQGHLKERSLGVIVFGREANYDTNQDPVVRTSACEVRKRLAQYYHEQEREASVQIDLPAGSYVPEFRYREVALAPSVAPIAPPAPGPRPLPIEITPPPPGPPLPARRWRRVAAIGSAAAVLVSAGAFAWRMNRSAVDKFWGPVWGNSESVMICLGGSAGAALPADADNAPTVWEVMRRDSVAFADAVTTGRLTGLFRGNGKRFDIRKAPAFTLNDFRSGPVVFVGAFNNPWTLRLENQLRFSFATDPEIRTLHYIRDRQNPGRQNWREDNSVAYTKLTADYAIVSRVLDPMTEKSVVVVAGLTKDGTSAAGEFATEERYLADLARHAQAGWERKNFQVVLSTEIINGIAGPPRIEATYFW